MLKEDILLLIDDFGTGSFYSAFLRFVARKLGFYLVELYSEASAQHPYEVVYFVENTIEFGGGGVFIIVVDPGVGSDRRRVLAVEYSDAILFVPEGNILRFLDEKRVNKVWRVKEEVFDIKGGKTFHGRDVFLPAAVKFLREGPSDFLEPVFDVKFGEPVYRLKRVDGGVEAFVVHVDNFGNMITNLKKSAIPFERFEVAVGFSLLDEVFSCYDEGPPEEPFLLWNSWGYLEIAVKNGSAAEYFGMGKGEKLYVFPR